MSDSNPIATRIDRLHDQWVAFAQNTRARLLIWCATRDEAALIEAFVARECEGDFAETPDLFVQLAVPFTTERAHGFALTEELKAHYAEVAETFDECEQTNRWLCPRENEGDGDMQLLLAALSSFRRHHVAESADARLVVWLTPTGVSSTAGYQLWLQRLTRDAPSELRFVVVDDAAVPSFSPLIAAELVRVCAVACALNMAPVVAEVAATGGEATPGDAFRAFQTRMGALISSGDLASAVPVAAAAVALCLTHAWPHLAASIQMMLAAAYSREAKHAEAIDAYRDAARLAAVHESHEAQGAAENEEPTTDGEREDESESAEEKVDAPTFGKQLRLQAMLGCASVMLATSAYPQAAATYLEAALLARELGDARSELDCSRLTSVCYAEHGERDKAWEIGMHGLQLGLAMDEEARKSSSLPYLAEHLVRLTKTKSGDDGRRKPLEDYLTRVLGTDWRAQLASAAEA